jgi:hypothetical protein
MKARIENGKVVKYNTIPKTLKKASGETILKANTLPEFELQQLGFYDVVVPTYNSVTQSINNLHFDNAYRHAGFDAATEIPQEVFVYDVIEKELDSLADLKSDKIAQLKANANAELAKTDWAVVRNTEKNVAIPTDTTTLRDTIRTTVDLKETEIDALTDKEAVITFNISL